MSKANINNTSLEYFECGQGDPVVLVHGSASDYRTWDQQQDELVKGYRVVIYSRRYHWPNTPIPEDSDYSMIEQAEDLRALLQSLDSGPVHLVGHSYGAFLCLLVAMKAPELVCTLTLAEPPVITLFVSNTPKPNEILKLMVTRPRTAAAIMQFGARGIAPATAAAKRGDLEGTMRIFGATVLGKEFFDKLPETRFAQVMANAIKAEFVGSGFPPLNARELSGIDTPVLLVAAEHSPRLFHRLVDALEKFLPRTERIEISGASHIMHEDNASAFNEAVCAFLEKHPRIA